MAFFLMTDVTRILGVFALSLVVCFIIYNWFQRRNYPPGPMGLPLFGHIFFLGKKPNITLRDIGNKYGGIFSFYIGPQLNICVTEYQMIKEILNHPMTLARPPHSFDFLAGRGGMSGMNGEEWREQRRFTMQTMRNLGLGKGLWETMIQEDAAELGKVLGMGNGKPMHFDEPVSISQLTNSASLLFGRHLNREDEKEDIEVMQRFGKEMMDHLSSVDININLPWIVKVIKFFNVKGFRNFMTLLRRFESIFEKELDTRLKLKDEIVREDFIGYYLHEMEKKDRESNNNTFTERSLLGNLFILLMAGHDSTVASMGWLFLLMAQYQNIQKKICNEIDQVIGRDGTIYYEDKIKLPYTMASILEMARWASISALFPPRYVLESFTFNGYEIPKGAHVVCNAWAMMHDPKYFEDPMEYKPERFLTKDGALQISRVEGYGPFSFGKRNCPGEGVAIMTVFLYFVTIMQKFNIKTPDGSPPNMDYKFSAGLLPYPQKLCFTER